MGFVLFLLMAALEITLAVVSCRTPAEKKVWRKNRLFVRLVQAALALCAIALPLGQRWRLAPAIGLLALLALGTAVLIVLRRSREEGDKRASGAVGSCVLSIALIGAALVPAMIFTGYNGLPTSGEHIVAETSVILIDAARTDPFESDGSFREVPVHFYYPADGGTQRYPLIVFSHGAFGYYQSNTSTYRELASNGYVVASLDHPHHAFFTQDTDGQLVLADRSFIQTALTLNEINDSAAQYALYRQWMTLRTADASFALDEIESTVRSGTPDASWYVDEAQRDALASVLNMTDVGAVGLMGHSMGGATAVALGRARNDVSAVVDLDGTMLGEYLGVENGEFVVNDAPYRVPVLDFNNWEAYSDIREYLASGYPYPNAEVIRRAENGFSVGIRGSKHMDFTDLPLLSPFLGNLLGSGERGAEETMTIVNSVVLSFFNCYLKGEGVFTAQETY